MYYVWRGVHLPHYVQFKHATAKFPAIHGFNCCSCWCSLPFYISQRYPTLVNCGSYWHQKFSMRQILFSHALQIWYPRRLFDDTLNGCSGVPSSDWDSGGLGSYCVIDAYQWSSIRPRRPLFRCIAWLPFLCMEFYGLWFVGNGENDSLLQLQTIPKRKSHELTWLVQTSYRSGFYLTSDTGRYNIRQQIWFLEDSPSNAITTWRWKSKTMSRNVWSWVHVFEQVLVICSGGRIIIQLLIIYQALKEGMLWTVDGSVAMAKPLTFRGLFAVLFWNLTGFWDLIEFCLRDAHEILGINQIFSFTASIRFDILFITASWASFLAHAAKDRIRWVWICNVNPHLQYPNEDHRIVSVSCQVHQRIDNWVRSAGTQVVTAIPNATTGTLCNQTISSQAHGICGISLVRNHLYDHAFRCRAKDSLALSPKSDPQTAILYSS